MKNVLFRGVAFAKMSVKALISEVERASQIASQNRHRFIAMLCTSELNEEVLKLA
jgi:hypothetical protein